MKKKYYNQYIPSLIRSFFFIWVLFLFSVVFAQSEPIRQAFQQGDPQAKTNQLERDLQTSQELNRQLIGGKESLDDQQKQLFTQLKNLQALRLALEKDKQAVEEERKNLQNEYAALSEQLANTRGEQGKTYQANNFANQLQERQKQLDQLREELNKLRKQQNELTDRYQVLTTQSDQKLKQLNQELFQSDQDKQKLIIQVGELDKQGRELNSNLQQALKDLAISEDARNKISMELEFKNALLAEKSKPADTQKPSQLEASGLKALEENVRLKKQLDELTFQFKELKDQKEDELTLLDGQLVQLHAQLSDYNRQKEEELSVVRFLKDQEITQLKQETVRIKEDNTLLLKQLEDLTPQLTQLKVQKRERIKSVNKQPAR